MFRAFFQVHKEMEVNIQGSQLNIAAQINYSNFKNEKQRSKENKNKNMHKAFFLSIYPSPSVFPPLFYALSLSIYSPIIVGLEL